MEASNFTPSVYSVHALTLLAEVKHSHICSSLYLSYVPSCSYSCLITVLRLHADFPRQDNDLPPASRLEMIYDRLSSHVNNYQ